MRRLEIGSNKNMELKMAFRALKPLELTTTDFIPKKLNENLEVLHLRSALRIHTIAGKIPSTVLIFREILADG